jgi:hypothetical protein
MKISNFKNLSDNLNMNKITKVFFLNGRNFKLQKTESRANKIFFAYKSCSDINLGYFGLKPVQKSDTVKISCHILVR